MKKHIPNFLTCMNLLCGCIALPYAILGFLGGSEWAAYLVFLAAFFDLLDGMAARLLKVHSEMGKQLDSLADMVSFGVVPGIMMISLLDRSNIRTMINNDTIGTIVQCFPLIITIFSALRLAKFNVDTRQATSFIGLPTPANAILIASLLYIADQNNPSWNAILLNAYFIIGSSILLSYLLISELPMFSLKMKTLSFRDNKIQYIFLIISVILFIIFFLKAIPLIIILYILLSLVRLKLKVNS